jgi:amidohydrolase
VRYGALTASCDALEITISGRGGHAARPHESLDPIAAAAQLISSLYLFIPRATDSHDPVVVTIGQISAGHNGNVIPERAVLRGTIRSLGREVRERTKSHIQQIARGIAEASGTKIEVRFEPGPQSVMNDEKLTDVLRAAAAELLGPRCVDLIPRPSMGGEDFAFYQEHVPGAMFRLGCSSPVVGAAPLHSSCFDLDEHALVIGAKVLARAAVLFAEAEPRSPSLITNANGTQESR